MLFESLETRRFLSVTLSSGTPSIVTVTQSSNGKVEVAAKGGSKSHLNVSVLERGGSLRVVEEETGATWDVTAATGVSIVGTKKNDNIYYDGDSIGAVITGSDGIDQITVADNGTGSSSVDAGKGDDSISLLIGNHTTILGGDGNDAIYLNTDTSNANIATATSVVDAGAGNDNITTYEGDNTINGGAGKDTLIDVGGALTNNTTSNIEIFA
jgi:Ca2+-binding RTX toxin-like protein